MTYAWRLGRTGQQPLRRHVPRLHHDRGLCERYHACLHHQPLLRLGLPLANDKWNLKVSSEEAVKLTVDQLAPISGIAKVVDVHGILIPLENADPVVDAMRHGHTLSVVMPAGEVSFKLSGTRD